MAGDNDDIAALVAQDIDRIIVQGSFIGEVKAGHADLHALYLIYIVVAVIAPDDTGLFQDFSGLKMALFRIVEHVVIGEVTALDAGFFQDLNVFRVHLQVDLALRTKRGRVRHRAFEITERHIIGLKIRKCF